MTTDQAVALYRAEKRAAVDRGLDVSTPRPIPGRFHARTYVTAFTDGHAWPRKDAFIVTRPRP